MKSSTDKFTSEMFGNRPGRPRKVNALTPAERTRKHRKTKAKAEKTIAVSSNENCAWCGGVRNACWGMCSIGQLGRKD
jgi:hypothetical protein